MSAPVTSPSATIAEFAGARQPEARQGAYTIAAIGIALLAVGVRAWMAWTTHSTAEDFLITLRYAENLAGGQGFAYNAGERVMGTTTPLYTLFLALCAWLRLDAAFCGKTANILADGVTCWLLARLPAREPMNLPVAGLFAALLYALGSTAINISIGGMETGLVTCAGLAAITALLCGNIRALCLLAAVLFLLRLDTLLLSGCLLMAYCLQTRRVPWRDLGIALLLVLPWLVFALYYFGSFVPTSLVAKILVYGHPQMSEREAIVGPFRQQFVSGALQCGLTLLACVGMVRVVKHREWRLFAPLLWLLVYYGIMLTSRVPAFAWYFLPPWPLFLLLACLGVFGKEKEKRRKGEKEKASRFPVSLNGNIRGVSAFLLFPFSFFLLLLFGLWHLRSVRADIQRAQELEDTVRQPVGMWLREHVQPEERVLLEPIGTIGYYSHARMLDMIGLTSPEVFPSYHTPAPLADIVRRLRPEWLCLRPNEVVRLQGGNAALLPTHYQEIRDFRAGDGRIVFVLYHRRQDSAPPVAQ